MEVPSTGLAQYQQFLSGIITTSKRNNIQAVSAISAQIKGLKIPELLNRQDLLVAKSETIKANRAIKNCVINAKGKNPVHKLILRVWYGIRTIFKKSPYPIIGTSFLIANTKQAKSEVFAKETDSEKVKSSKLVLSNLKASFTEAGISEVRTIGAYDVIVEQDGSLSIAIIEKGATTAVPEVVVYKLKKEGDSFSYQKNLFSSASDFLEYYVLEIAKTQLSSPETHPGVYVDTPEWKSYKDHEKDSYQITRNLKQENGEIETLTYIEKKKFQAEVDGKSLYFSSAEEAHQAMATKLGVTLQQKRGGQEIYATGIDEAKAVLSKREPGDWLLFPSEEKMVILIVGKETPTLTHEFSYSLRDIEMPAEARRGVYPLKPTAVGVATEVVKQVAVLKEVKERFFVTDPGTSVKEQVETIFAPFIYKDGDIPIESPYIILPPDQGKTLAKEYALDEGTKFDADFYVVARPEKGSDDKLFFSRMNPVKVLLDGRLWDGARTYDTIDAVLNQWHLPIELKQIENLQLHAKMLLEDVAVGKNIEKINELLKGKKGYSLSLQTSDDFTSLKLTEYTPHLLTTAEESYSITVLPNGQVSKRSSEGREVERYEGIVEFKASLERLVSLKAKDAKRAMKEAEIQRRYAEMGKIQAFAKEGMCSSEKEAWDLLKITLSNGYPAENCCFIYAKPDSFEMGVLYVSKGEVQITTLSISDKVYLKRGDDKTEVSAEDPFAGTELTFKDAESIRKMKKGHDTFIAEIKARKDFRGSMAAIDIEALAKDRLLEDSQKNGGYVISIERDEYGVDKPCLYEIDGANRIQKKQITDTADLEKLDTSKGIDSLKKIAEIQAKKWESAGSKIRALSNFIPGIAEKLSLAKLGETKRYFGSLEPGVFAVSQVEDQPTSVFQKAGLWIGKKLGGEKLLQRALIGETGKYIFSCVNKGGDISEHIVTVNPAGQYVLGDKQFASLEGDEGLLQAIGATDDKNRVADMDACKAREAYIEQQRYFYPRITDESMKQIKEGSKFIGPCIFTKITDGEYLLQRIDGMSKETKVSTRSKPGKYEFGGAEFSSLEEVIQKFIL